MLANTSAARPILGAFRTANLRYTSTHAPSAIPTPASSAPLDPNLRPDLVKKSPYVISSSVILSRPPYLTPTLHPFEESYYFYQRRLNQRLSLPFTRYFYFKKDSPMDLEYKRKAKLRSDAYTGFGGSSWKDELTTSEGLQHEEDNGWARLRETTVTKEDVGDEEGVVREEKVVEKPLPRRVKADEEGDLKSLDREGERTLFLVVKGESGEWEFPRSGLVEKKLNENLREAAIRTLEQAAGPNMNTWFVGNVPIGHYVVDWKESKERKVGEKVFFMKARIMAGQADLTENKLGYKDFMWLTKDELKQHVKKSYWKHIENILAMR